MFGGHAALYQVSPPFTFRGAFGNVEWLIAYSVDKSCPKQETILYPANEDCKVLHWEELSGSYVLGIDHHKSLAQMGYPNIQKHRNYVDLKRERIEIYE